MATYDNNLKLEEITTGDASGQWGDKTNVNLELIGEALSYGTKVGFASDADNTNFALANAPTSCLLYTSPSPRDRTRSRMPSSA